MALSRPAATAIVRKFAFITSQLVLIPLQLPPVLADLANVVFDFIPRGSFTDVFAQFPLVPSELVAVLPELPSILPDLFAISGDLFGPLPDPRMLGQEASGIWMVQEVVGGPGMVS